MVQQEQKDLVFFTKKKIVLITLGIFIFGLFIFLIYKYFFEIEFSIIFSTISEAFQQNKLFFLWLSLLIGFPVFASFWRIWPYYYKLKQQNIYVEWYNWIIFCFMAFLISSITPFAVGSEPYCIYWMKKRGLSTKESTSITASFFTLNPFIQIIITWPSFFIISASYSQFQDNVKWVTSFWLVFFGLMIDLISSIFWLTVSISRRFHYIINLVINKIYQILRMKYKQKEEIKTEYFTNASFKKTFLNQMKDWKFVISIVVGGIVWNVYYYSTLILSFNLIDPNNTLNPGELFNYVNVASTANNLVPIPGAEGTIQAMLLLFIQSSAERQDGMNVNPEALKNIINSSVIIWRTFTFYLTTALGAGFFLLFLFKESYKTRQKNRRNKSSLPHKTFSVLIPFSNDFDFMQYSVNSVLSNSYNRERIQIVLVNHGSPLPPSRQEIVNKILGNNCNVDYYQYPTNNLNELLNQALAQNWIRNDYLQILEPRSFLNFAFLEHVDNIAASNDVYFGRFRQVKSNFKKTHIISPYFFLARRKEVDRSKINFEKINPFNTFIKVSLLKKYQKFNMLPTQSLATYLNNIITKAPSVRYLWRLSGNYYPATEKWTNLPVKTYVDNETNNKYISLNS